MKGFLYFKNSSLLFHADFKPTGKTTKNATNNRKKAIVNGAKSLIAFPIKIFPAKNITTKIRKI